MIEVSLTHIDGKKLPAQYHVKFDVHPSQVNKLIKEAHKVGVNGVLAKPFGGIIGRF